MHDIHVTLRGNIASEPRHVRFDDGNTVTSFRLASTARRFDRDLREWVNRETTYVSVNCRKSMAANAASSLRKGHPVVVTGRLWERSWASNGKTGQSLEIEAETLGHDLAFGTTQFERIVRVERISGSNDPEGDRLAYQLAQDSAETEGSVIADVTGMAILDDPGDMSQGDTSQGDPGQGDPGQGDPGQGDPGQGDPGQGDPGRAGAGLAGAGLGGTGPGEASEADSAAPPRPRLQRTSVA